MKKPPRVSGELARAIERRAVANGPILVRESIAPGKVTPHHLRPVYGGQQRRSNPIVVGLTEGDHGWLHNYPDKEEEMRGYLLREALINLASDDVELLEEAIKAVLEKLEEREQNAQNILP